MSGETELLRLIEQVRRRELGFGKAAELAGVPVGAFLDAMARHRVTPFDYDSDELDRELSF